MNDYDPHQQYQEPGLHRVQSMYGVPAGTTSQFGQYPHHHLYPSDFSQWQTTANHTGYNSSVRSAYSTGACGFMTHPGLAGRFSPSMVSGQAANSLVATSGSGMTSLGSPLMAAAHQAVGGQSLGLNGGGDFMSSLGQHHGGMHPASYHAGLHNMQDHHRTEISSSMKLSLTNDPPTSKSKKSHIKKPLNAFMLFMKEMRASVVAECSLKESAAINQILGRKWHALTREAQAKYYEMARKEKELHLQLYPGWSARDNYATHSKRKRACTGQPVKVWESFLLGKECVLPKKCRSKYVMEPPAVTWSKQSNMMSSDSFPLTASPSHSQSSYESMIGHHHSLIGVRNAPTTAVYENSPNSMSNFLPSTSLVGGPPDVSKLSQHPLRCPPLQLGVPGSGGHSSNAYTELQPVSALNLQQPTDGQGHVTLTQLS